MALYKIFMQKFPGNNRVWVEKLENDDPIWSFSRIDYAENKRYDLDTNDQTERVYTVKKVD